MIVIHIKFGLNYAIEYLDFDTTHQYKLSP